MNFGFIAAAMALMIVAFLVATSREELSANTPSSRGIVAAVHGHKRHHIQMAGDHRGPGHSALAALNREDDSSFP